MEVGVHLTTVGSQGEADVICSMLRAFGIECADREATGTWTGSMASGLWREILVAEGDLEAARRLLPVGRWRTPAYHGFPAPNRA